MARKDSHDKPSRLSFSRREHASKGANKLFTADRLLHENPSGESEGQLLLCVSRDHEEWYCPRRQREGRGASADPREEFASTTAASQSPSAIKARAVSSRRATPAISKPASTSASSRVRASIGSSSTMRMRGFCLRGPFVIALRPVSVLWPSPPGVAIDPMFRCGIEDVLVDWSAIPEFADMPPTINGFTADHDRFSGTTHASGATASFLGRFGVRDKTKGRRRPECASRPDRGQDGGDAKVSGRRSFSAKCLRPRPAIVTDLSTSPVARRRAKGPPGA